MQTQLHARAPARGGARSLGPLARPYPPAWRCNAAQRPTAPRAALSPVASSAYTDFSSKVSGEWEGVSVSFSAAGTPEPLPEYYVPEAYRDWGVELFDWQTHCSTLASEDGVKVAVKRLMPTVGCEADAVAFVEEASSMFAEALSLGFQPTVLPDGSYSTGPQCVAADANKLVVESCFAGQGAGRVKVVQHLMKGWQDGRWFTSKVDVHNEMYDAPFSAGTDIRSCGYRMGNFSQEPPAAAEQLSLEWGDARGMRYTMQYSGEGPGSLAGVSVEAVQGGRLAEAAVPEPMMLPMGVWCGVHQEGSRLITAAGVLPQKEGESRRVLAVRVYAEGRLQEVVLGSEDKLAR